jgi:hypothetical protein
MGKAVNIVQGIPFQGKLHEREKSPFIRVSLSALGRMR